jgi:hypothetical protein
MACSDERFGEEALGPRCIAFGREQEVAIVAALESKARYKYTHLPLTRT